MKKQIAITVGIMLIVVVVLGGVKYMQISKAIADSQNFAPPPSAVTSIVAAEVDWQRTLQAVGSLQPTQGVTLSAEVPGKVVKINFNSGEAVEAGAVLIELDTSVEEGNLNAARAREEKARKSLARAQALKGSNAMSREEFDNTDSDFRAATSEVASLQALIARKKIIAPFAGRTGIRMVNLGEYLKEGTQVVPLHDLNSMYVNFSLPQQALGTLAVGNKVNFTVDAYENQQFEGAVSAINPQIDIVTRQVEVQATVPNPEGKLRAGMYTKVHLILPTVDRVIAIPSSSINFAPYGDTLYVIEKMKNEKEVEYSGVRLQVVKTGARRGNQIAIVSGLKPGEEVVTSAPFKLMPKAPVVVNNTISPSNDVNPKPENN